MSDNTKIEWTDATWNPITGCKVVSPGCTNCYAMKLAGTRLAHHPSRSGLTIDTKAGPVWNGELRFNSEWLFQPLRWKRPRRIFVCAHGDLFAEGVEDSWLDQIFAVMACSPQHIFQVLTKRPKRMRDYLTTSMLEHRLAAAQGQFDFPLESPGFWPHLPLSNVWLGVSVEDQERARERIPLLLDTPATVRWISAEPLLGPLDLGCLDVDGDSFVDALHLRNWEDEIAQWRDSDEDWEEQFLDWYGLSVLPSGPMSSVLDWVVVGGESGSGARPMHPDWARSLRDQCAKAGVPFFFKQWGNWQIASEANGHADHNMNRNDAFWIDIDGTQHKPQSTGLDTPYAMHRVSKAVAGRLLDGIEHNAMPGGQQ